MGAGPRRRRGAARQTAAAQARERDQETIRLINEAAADDSQEGLAQLRKLAAVRGLVNNDVRARLWPRLAGVPSTALTAPAAAGTTAGAAVGAAVGATAGAAAGTAGPADCNGHNAAQTAYEVAAASSHKDATTVRCDVERSLWHLVPSDSERGVKREALARLLNALVVGSNGDVHYYQGLHDVASILLMVAGEERAHAMLERLATCHLRDATRPSLDAVIDLLQLLQPLLEEAEPKLAVAIVEHGLPPFFALSWFITWFSHDLHDLGECARLFDLFLASHPLMPLYVGAVAMRSQAKRLLACEEMPELHTALVNLGITRALTADALAHQAIELYKQLPPSAILSKRRVRITQCVAPRAFQRNGAWCVPAAPRQPASKSQLWSNVRVSAILQALNKLPLSGARKRKGLALVSVTGGLLGLYVCVYCSYLIARLPQGSW